MSSNSGLTDEIKAKEVRIYGKYSHQDLLSAYLHLFSYIRKHLGNGG